jgi:hypothetical protein
MSLFDYPRINFRGAVTLPASWGPFAGQTLALVGR